MKRACLGTVCVGLGILLLACLMVEAASAIERGLQGRDDILFFCDFESGTWYNEWGLSSSPTGPGGAQTVTLDSDPVRLFEPFDGKAVRAQIRAGQKSSSLDGMDYRFQQQIGYEPEEIYWRHYVRFADDWSPEGQGKLPGFGGTYNRGGWGGKPSDGYNGWSARGWWWYTTGNPPTAAKTGYYVYHVDQPGDYGSNWVWSRPGGDDWLVGWNQWYCVEQYCKMNTPGQNDGILRAWIDGEEVFEKTDIRFRDTTNLKIEKILASSIYFNTPAATWDHLYIDNVVIAKNYIGPAVLSYGDCEWTNPAGGNWTNTANWVGGMVPGGSSTDIATFGNVLTGNATIDRTGANQDMGGLVFNSAAYDYTIGGTGQTMGWVADTQYDLPVTVSSGNHTVNVQWHQWSPGGAAVYDYLVLDVAAGSTLTLHSYDAEGDHNIIYDWQGRIRPGIKKIGAGTAILICDNSDNTGRNYRGDTIVDEGTLLVNNTSGWGLSAVSTVQVNNGGTLGGSGFIGQAGWPGVVNVHSGGTIAPGSSVGTLTLNNGLTLYDGSNLNFELGTTSDLLRVTGGTFTVIGTGGVNVSVADSGGLVAGNTYDLIDWNGATTSGVEVDDFQMAAGTYAGSSFAISDNILQLTVVPEPGTIMILLSGSVGLLVLGRQVPGSRVRGTRHLSPRAIGFRARRALAECPVQSGLQFGDERRIAQRPARPEVAGRWGGSWGGSGDTHNRYGGSSGDRQFQGQRVADGG